MLVRRLILLYILVAFPVAQAGIVTDCLRLLGVLKTSETSAGPPPPKSPWEVRSFGLLFEGHAITGPDLYTEPLILNHLDILPTQNSVWDSAHFEFLRNKRIVSLGEGMSSLVLMLRKNGMDARAVDVWYGRDDYPTPKQSQDLHWFLEQYRAHPEALIRGDARKLEFPDESQDIVLSHQLLNQFTMADKKRILLESIRIASVGGEIRHYGLSEKHLESILPFLREHFGNAIEISTVQKESALFHPSHGRMLMSAKVLILRKKAKTQNPTVSFTAEEELPEPPPKLPPPPLYRSEGITVRGLR